tara:strand:- start:272 stop:466 length:195 start_codon:yes stop_codon:yes gene_type:complete
MLASLIIALLFRMVFASEKIFKTETWEQNPVALSLDKKWSIAHCSSHMHPPASCFDFQQLTAMQ